MAKGSKKDGGGLSMSLHSTRTTTSTTTRSMSAMNSSSSCSSCHQPKNNNTNNSKRKYFLSRQLSTRGRIQTTTTTTTKSSSSSDSFYYDNDDYDYDYDYDDEQQRQRADELMTARKSAHLSTSIRKRVFDSWQLVRDDLDTLGLDFFMRIFQTYPHLMDLFPFGNVKIGTVHSSEEEKDKDKNGTNDNDVDGTTANDRLMDALRNSKMLQAHASGVMKTVGVAVAGLADADMETNLIPKLRQLGRMHTLVGVKPEYYDLIYGILIDTIRDHVGQSHWSKEIQEAWHLCYSVITSVMKDPSRHLSVEPPEGWGLWNASVCAYIAISTPFRLVGFTFATVTSNRLFHVILFILDFIAAMTCLLDWASERIQNAIQLKSSQPRRNNTRQSKNKNKKKSRQYGNNGYGRTDDRKDENKRDKNNSKNNTQRKREMKKKKRKPIRVTIQHKFERAIFPWRFRLNRTIRRLRLSQWAPWPNLDQCVLISYAFQYVLLNNNLFHQQQQHRTVYFVTGLMRCISFARVLHYVKCSELIGLKRATKQNNVASSSKFNSWQWHRLAGVLLYMIHLFACLYCIVAQLEASMMMGGNGNTNPIDGEYRSSSFAPNIETILEPGHVWRGYLQACYWAFVNVAGIGNSESVPETSLEIIFTILVHLLGATYYAIAAGSIFTLLEDQAKEYHKVGNDIANLTEFMDSCDIPKSSQDRFVSSYMMTNLIATGTSPTTGSSSSNTTGTTEYTTPLLPEAAETLPSHLSLELTMFSRAKALRTRGLKSCYTSEEFSFELAESLSATVTLLPGDYIFQAGDRITRKVMMVDKGVLEIISTNGTSRGCLYPGDIVTGKGWLATVSDESMSSKRYKANIDWMEHHHHHHHTTTTNTNTKNIGNNNDNDTMIAIAGIRAMSSCRLVMGLSRLSDIHRLRYSYPDDMLRLERQFDIVTPPPPLPSQKSFLPSSSKAKTNTTMTTPTGTVPSSSLPLPPPPPHHGLVFSPKVHSSTTKKNKRQERHLGQSVSTGTYYLYKNDNHDDDDDDEEETQSDDTDNNNDDDDDQFGIM